jgi:hypothetical protein
LKGKWFNVAGKCRRNVRASVNHTDAYFARRALPSRRLVPFQEANRARAKPSFYGAVRPKRLLLRMISPRHFSSGAWSLMGFLVFIEKHDLFIVQGPTCQTKFWDCL